MDATEAISQVIDTKLSEFGHAVNDNIDNRLDSFQKSELSALLQKFEAVQTQVDKLETTSKRNAANAVQKDWVGRLTGLIRNEESFGEMVRSNKGATFNIGEFSTKILTGETDYVDSTTGNNVVPAAYQPGIIFDPDRASHVREYLPSGSTTSDSIRYLEETSYVDGTAPRTTGSLMGETTFDLTVKDAQVRNVSTYVRLTDEMLSDVSGLTSYLSARLPKKIRVKEDNMLLYGVDAPFTFTGITEVAAAYVDELADANVNRYDVLIKAIAQVRDFEYKATAIMVHPDDYFNMLLIKDGYGQYVMPDAIRFGTEMPRIAGVPLVANTAITTGDFLVGDFSLGAQLFDRQQSSVRFFEQDQDNAIRGVITVVANERIALPIYRPNAFVYGTFAAALTAGAS